jgi:hypothetical protein
MLLKTEFEKLCTTPFKRRWSMTAAAAVSDVLKLIIDSFTITIG